MITRSLDYQENLQDNQITKDYKNNQGITKDNQITKKITITKITKHNQITKDYQNNQDY